MPSIDRGETYYFGRGKELFGSLITQAFHDLYENPNLQTDLSILMNKYGSDKGKGHNYAALYQRLFKSQRESIKNVFEVGLGTNNLDVPSNMGPSGRPGASLRGWRDFFPLAQVYGADVDKRVLFQENRISTFYVNQTNPRTIDDVWTSLREGKSTNQNEYPQFDIFIDDGLHESVGAFTLFDNSIACVKPGGFYIIEDILRNSDTMAKYIAFFTQRRVDGVLAYIPTDTEHNGDNSLLIIKARSDRPKLLQRSISWIKSTINRK